ncbi:hypothetical protein D9M71_654050 [compost metagenome]
MFARGEARALGEVEDAGGFATKLRASSAGGFQVLAFLFRVLFQVGLGVALHERKAQCPPGQANDRYPDQLLLEEKLQRADAAIEHVLQHQDVDPALVVAGDQVGMLVVEAFKAGDAPAGMADQVHPRLVVADPGLVNVAHQPVAQALGSREGQA